MKIDGGCLCGFLRFEAEVDPERVFICHCADCQTQSGTSFRTIVQARPESLALTASEPKIYLKRAESGNVRSLAFCPECGTSIYGGPKPGQPGFLSLRVGAIRQREQLRPVAQVWCRSAQPWLETMAALPRIETQPGAGRSD
jgi:hypothetical protein